MLDKIIEIMQYIVIAGGVIMSLAISGFIIYCIFMLIWTNKVNIWEYIRDCIDNSIARSKWEKEEKKRKELQSKN